MKIALNEALKAYEKDEVPIGAVVVCENEVIGLGHNLRESTNIITNHAEIIAIQMAAKHLNSWKLNNCSLYTTLEPCAMCLGAIKQSRINKIYIASSGNQKKNYMLNSDQKMIENFHFGIYKEESQKLLKLFFNKKRNEEK